MRKILIVLCLATFWLSSCISADTEILVDKDFWVIETAVIDMSEFASIMLSMWSEREDMPTCVSIIAEFQKDDNIYNADRMDCTDLWNYMFETVITWWNIHHIVQQIPWGYEVNLSSLTWETSDELDEMGESFLESMTLDTRYVFPYKIEKTNFGIIWEDGKTLILNIDDYLSLWSNDVIVKLLKDTDVESKDIYVPHTEVSHTFTIKEYVLTRNQVIHRYWVDFIGGLNIWLEQMTSSQQQQILTNISQLPSNFLENHRHAILIRYIELHIHYLNL